MTRKGTVISFAAVVHLLLCPAQSFAQDGASYEEMVEFEKANAELHGDNISVEASFAPGQFLVKFKRGVSEDKKKAIHAKHGVRVKGKIREIGVEKLRVPGGKTVPGIVRVYKKNPNVEYAEPDFVAEVMATVPDDPYFHQQWGLSAIQAEEAWDIETGASNPVIISIVDTGVDYNHPDLAAKVLPGYNFVNKDEDPMDDQNHGTHCAGIASAITNNMLGIAGVSWHAFIMPFKVINRGGFGTYSNIAKGIVTAASWGADIISLSLGGESYSATLEDAVNYAYGQGCFIVAAAGNSGDERLLYPAACNKAMGVAATDQYDRRASFSSYGNHVEISAPGVRILSTIMDPYYAYLSGTSMSTPFVAGLAALIWSKRPELTNDEVEEVILQTADDIYPDGFDIFTGYGKINALRAMQLLELPELPELPEPPEPQVEVADIFITPQSLDVGRRSERSFMIHVIPQEPMDVARGDDAEVVVDVDGDGAFEEDERFDAVVFSAGKDGMAMHISIKVYLRDSLEDNQPGVAIYSINDIGIVYPDGSDIDDLWLNTFTPRRRRSSRKS